MPPTSSGPTVQDHVAALREVLHTTTPARRYERKPTAARLARSPGGTPKLPTQSTQRSIRPGEVNGRECAIPLTVERVKESGQTPYHDAVRQQVDTFLADVSTQSSTSQHLPPAPYVPGSPINFSETYAAEAQLQGYLMSDLQPAATVMRFVDGGQWSVEYDEVHANSATATSVTAADVVLLRLRGGEWEGAVTEEKAATNEQFESSYAGLLRFSTFPYFVAIGEGQKKDLYYWDEAGQALCPVSGNPTLRFAVQILSILTSRIRRSTSAGLVDPYIPLIVTNGNLFFTVLGRIDRIDDEDYGRIGLTQMDSVEDFPLRVLLFGHALMHQLKPVLPPPPGYTLDQALKVTTNPSVAFKSCAKAEAAALALKRPKNAGAQGGGRRSGGGIGAGGGSGKGGRRDGSAGGKAGGKGGGRGELTRGGTSKAGGRALAMEAELGNLSWLRSGRRRPEDVVARHQPTGGRPAPPQTRYTLPDRFDLVAAWWGGGQSLPITFQIVPVRDSSTENRDSVPTVIMDQLLGQNGSLFVAKSTALDIVFKEVWVADDNVDEVLNERATFEELYRHHGAADFLVGYVGFFESTLGSHYCLVTEAGEAVADWTRERDAVISIVEQLHRHGFVHGDLASRNVVKTPAGIRLIDLGRAKKAEGDDCEREMRQLKQVLAGEAEELDYGWLGYPTW